MEGCAEKFETLISNLKSNLPVTPVSETWASYSRENIKPRIIDEYQTYYGTEGNTLKSGCEFYTKNGFKLCQWTDLDMSVIAENNEFQTCWIGIKNDRNPNILIGCYYRHLRKSSNDVFLEKLRQTIYKVKRSNKYIIVRGDFNLLHLLHLEHNEYVNDFVNIMCSNVVHSCITEPTHQTTKVKPD